MNLIHLPNLISVGRLLLTPVTVMAMVAMRFDIAFWLFMIAGISDAVDGIIARQFNARTVLGGYLDPLADKVLLVSVYITLGAQDLMPHWIVILVVARDFAIIGGALLFSALGNELTMKPLQVSKLNTALQIVFAVYTLSVLGLGMSDFGMSDILCYAVAMSTVCSGVAYLVVWSRKAVHWEEGNS